MDIGCLARPGEKDDGLGAHVIMACCTAANLKKIKNQPKHMPTKLFRMDNTQQVIALLRVLGVFECSTLQDPVTATAVNEGTTGFLTSAPCILVTKHCSCYDPGMKALQLLPAVS
jgi:hypothetical protein